VRLLSPGDIRDLAAQYGVHPSKSRGQNFVVDAGTVRRIVNLAERVLDLAPGQRRALEVGPGFGSLTLGLLAAGWHVAAVEIDPILAGALPAIAHARVPDAQDGALDVIVDDVLKVRQLPDPPPMALIANLPYNVSVPAILHALATWPSLRGALVMVQAEVAERLVAGPGGRDYGVPSAKLAWYAAARQVGRVGRAAFWPVPRVDSALVALTRRPPPPATAQRQAVFHLIDAAFSQRRKMLRSALANWAGGSERAGSILAEAGIDPTWRAERLSISDFARLAECKGE
jgi:16S rRNA (adenine1518-N6/adenine1519-N6)-dimethyltransferase